MDGRRRFRRVLSFPSAPGLPPAIRAALDDIPAVDLGVVQLWQVSAEAIEGPIPAMLLQLWRDSGPTDHASRGLTPLIDARTLISVAPSPDATPEWVCQTLWGLPSHGEINRVVLTARDGTRWEDAWMSLPVFMRLPEGVGWDDVVDIAVDHGDGTSRPGEVPFDRRGSGAVAHCPFTLGDDDPLRARAGGAGDER